MLQGPVQVSLKLLTFWVLVLRQCLSETANCSRSEKALFEILLSAMLMQTIIAKCLSSAVAS